MSRYSTRIYVGDLPRDVRSYEVDDCFRRYGRIRSMDVKAGFAFVDYNDDRDAEDALRDMNGRDFLGRRVKVEFARADRDRPRDDRRGNETPSSSAAAPSRGAAAAPRLPLKPRTEHRALITGMNTYVSWQDLREFASEFNPQFADVKPLSGQSRGGPCAGVLEFETAADLQAAVSKLDGGKVKGDVVKVEEEINAGRNYKDLTGGDRRDDRRGGGGRDDRRGGGGRDDRRRDDDRRGGDLRHGGGRDDRRRDDDRRDGGRGNASSSGGGAGGSGGYRGRDRSRSRSNDRRRSRSRSHDGSSGVGGGDHNQSQSTETTAAVTSSTSSAPESYVGAGGQ